MIPIEVARLAVQFLLRQQGDAFLRPDLAVRMWIAAAHYFAFVFEYLDMVDVRAASQIALLLDPALNDPKNLPLRHLSQAQVVPRRKAKDPADATLRYCTQENSIYD